MNRVEVKKDNVCLNRIEEKCINCGMCLKTCQSINNFENDCINCGQCILTCPTGALTPKYDYQKVLNYLEDTDYTVVVFTAPAVRVAIGDAFSYPPGSFLEGKRYSNSLSIEKYINNNKKTVEETLDEKSIRQEYVILGLRMLHGINVQEFYNRFNVDFFQEFNKEYEKLLNLGLIVFDNGYIKLTNKGLDFANIVWEEFI